MKARLRAFLADAYLKALAVRPLLSCLAYGHVRRNEAVGPQWFKATDPYGLDLNAHACERCGLVYWEKAR